MAFDPDVYLKKKTKVTDIITKRPEVKEFDPDIYIESKTKIPTPEEPEAPGILERGGLISRLGRQYQAGQEITERELTELLGGPEMVPEERRIAARPPLGVPELIAKKAGEYLAPQPMLMGVPGAARAMEPAIQTGVMFAKKAISPVTRLLGQPLRKVGKPVAEGISFVGEMLSGVNKKFFERAIKKEATGKSIFTGKWDPRIYSDLGKKAQQAVNWLERETGKEVGKAKEIIRKAKKFTETKKFITKIDDSVKQSKFGKIQTLNKTDLSNIDELKNLIKKSKTLEELQGVKEIAQGMTKYGTETVAKSSTRGQGIIKELAKDLADEIAEKAPKLKKANVKFTKIKTLKKALQTELKDKSVARNLKNITTKSEYVQNLFNELDELAPKQYRFMDNLQDAIAREPFERLFPGKGGGSGSAEGFANILRLGTIGTVAPYALPALSPKIQQQIIKRTGRIPVALQRIIKRTPIARKPLIMAGLRLKGERQ